MRDLLTTVLDLLGALLLIAALAVLVAQYSLPGALAATALSLLALSWLVDLVIVRRRKKPRR